MKKKALFFVLLAGVLLINTSLPAALGGITPVLTILLFDDGFPVVEPRVVTLNDVLVRPWGLAFLPDNRMLVTEKGGRMLLLSEDGTILQEMVSGLPIVEASGQGGLLDVALASPRHKAMPLLNASLIPWSGSLTQYSRCCSYFFIILTVESVEPPSIMIYSALPSSCAITL